MYTSCISNTQLTSEQRQLITDVLKQARSVLERISSIAYDELRIRDFRRDFVAGKLDRYIQPQDRLILNRVIKEIEPLVIEGYIKLVSKFAKQSIRRGTRMDCEDLVQEGLEVIILSLMGYTGETNLTTYVANIVIRHFHDIAKKQNTNKRGVITCNLENFDTFSETDSNSIDCDYDREIFAYAMQCVRLTPLEKIVMDLMSDGVPHPCVEVSRMKNPETGDYYLISKAQYAQKCALNKIAAMYQTLVLRSQSRSQVA